MIKNNYNYFLTRGLPEKKIKYRDKVNHLTYERKEKLYEYFICDNCGCEIKIKNKWEHSAGGVILIPAIMTKKNPITIAVCNKCLNSVLKEFEEDE